MQIFDYRDYKSYVVERIQNMPKRGRGEFRKISEKLGVTSTVVSQIFKGERNLTSDQGHQVAEYLGLNELETRYFLLLVQRDRAGTHKYKKYLSQEIAKIAKEGKTVKTRIVKFEEISEELKGKFYSDWIYSATRIATSLSDVNTVDELSDYFSMSRERIARVVEFLLETGLCVEEGGRLQYGPQHTHLHEKSPFINTHRRNWRGKSMERINNPQEQDLFYSLIISLSKEDVLAIKEQLVEAISKAVKKASASEPEQLACLNIDWFGVR